MTTDPRKVFIIHGRNVRAAKEMAKFVRGCGLDPVEFDELRARMKGTPAVAEIVTRGMEEAQGVIALFTGDERAELHPDLRTAHDKQDDQGRWQSRPNVIFEAGMAFGRARDRVVFVVLGNAELFTDVAGIHFLRPGNAVPGGRSTLRNTLKSMGCQVSESDAWMTTDYGDFEACVLPEVSIRCPFNSGDNLHDASSAARRMDLATVSALLGVVEPGWMLDWIDDQRTNSQFVREEALQRLQSFIEEARRPDRQLNDQGLQAACANVTRALIKYLDVSAAERVPHAVKKDTFVISVKSLGAEQQVDEYDKKHEAQVGALMAAVGELEPVWMAFVHLATLAQHDGD